MKKEGKNQSIKQKPIEWGGGIESSSMSHDAKIPRRSTNKERTYLQGRGGYLLMIREINSQDFEGLMALYTQLHNNPMPKRTAEIEALWQQILEDRSHHIIVAEEDGKIVASCVCVIIPNLTHGQRPYAFVENVITDVAYRKRGLATACLDYAKEIAERENCYKMMLLTGSKEESTLKFYERAGYNRKDKTAFIQWL